jgi:hypothetical protein
MWQWLKQWFVGSNTQLPLRQQEIRLSEDGVYHRPWMRPYENLWPWDSVCEFGLSVHEAIFSDPWLGDYMEAEWFFTVEDSEGRQRLLFDIEHFSLETLPALLDEKLSGFDRAALQEGWRQHQAGPRNLKGAGQWLGWKKEDFIEPNS